MEHLPLVLDAISTAVILALAAQTWWKFKKSSVNDNQKVYEDEDGAATDDSQKEYLAVVRILKYAVIAVWSLGCPLSLSAAILTTTATRAGLSLEWFAFASWVFISPQITVLYLERKPVQLFESALRTGFAFLLLAASIVSTYILEQYSENVQSTNNTSTILDAVHFLAGVVALILCLSFPRRPLVSFFGHAVDKEYTVSILGRYSFSWINSLLSFAKANKGLDLKDLPYLHLGVRSAQLHDQFNKLEKKNRLWKTLLTAHYIEALYQTGLSTVHGVLSFIPSIAMYKFLRLLEERSEGEAVNNEAWAWIFGLGSSIMITNAIESWLLWVVWARLGALIRSELSALIVAKSTRRKDVKIAPGSQNSEAKPSTGTPDSTAIDGYNSKQDEADEEEAQKSRQAQINLVGVDTKRVSDFATFWYLFPATLVRLIVSISILVTLIGWAALLSGLAVFVLVLPLNIYTSKAFTKTQGELMTLRDQKMVVITEALQGIRQIKFSALEQQWESKIRQSRSAELAKQRKVFCLDTILISIWILGPVMLSAVALAVYAMLYGSLTPAVAFTTIAIFAQIEVNLAIIPELTADALEAWVSLQRIAEYFEAPEKEQYIVPGVEISYKNASIAWPLDEDDPERFTLRNLNITFPRRKLSVISGQTGSGKSLLLASIIGEVDKVAGRIEIPVAPPLSERYDFKANKSDWILDSAIAFVAQICFIENATIKENIIFGLPYDASRYRKVVSACALTKDLEMLTDGDSTDIGANGINLSGGQKWRLSFARALYSRAGILVLDDIFSAVDAHVGRHLYEEALTGDLGRGRTRILVTHHIELCLPSTSYAVILSNGTVERAGSVDELQNNGILNQIISEEQDAQSRPEEYQDPELLDYHDNNTETMVKVITRESETVNVHNYGMLDTKLEAQPKKFTEEETRESGAIKVSIYKEYLGTSGGPWFWTPILLLYTTYQAMLLGRAWWVSLWTRSNESQAVLFSQNEAFYSTSRTLSTRFVVHGAENSNLTFYLSVYVGISVAICFMGTIRYFCVFMGSLKASRILFERLTYTILRAPLRWLDTVPLGRILNRFTADFVAVDSRMGNDLGFMLYQMVQLIGIIVAGLFVSPFMLLFAIVLLILCIFIALHFLTGAREVKRLESNYKSPIFEQFGSILVGLGTIRAFDKAEVYTQKMFSRIDDHARAFWFLWLCNRWLMINLNIIGAFFAIFVAAIIVLQPGIDASLAGFALSFALQYSNAMIWTIRQYASVELAMNATERIVEYSKLPTEDQGGQQVSAAWPPEGRLEVEGLIAGYAPELPPVIKGLSFSIDKNERVGVVGRTGAGKSSLTLALFRFLEARAGSITIDGVDISKIKLHDLRSRLAIIPQDPVLFSGTVRSNLDAFSEHNDTELFEALERVHLIRNTRPGSRDELLHDESGGTSTTSDSNANIFGSLQSRISEGGLNLSQGQRQLLCLARAIVSRPKIMVLDEATSAVDMATDVLIQRSIREEFQDSTLLVIAHRLSTIADFDKILVMSDGMAAEFDTPKALMEKKGVFWEMVQQSGERQRLEMEIGAN
ncbi:MAG: hypothetical protein HETSPECPRED_006056 [Heterodermia speciosa]|uniref:ABC transporter n=1 Tax=Heterodermia speciosa TaxID=116794 RepID=A0A8H3EKD3_9LECA|nr:MAG: hypothetical protein HETSPECPRED_006056 [Heterodermia speciosa]